MFPKLTGHLCFFLCSALSSAAKDLRPWDGAEISAVLWSASHSDVLKESVSKAGVQGGHQYNGLVADASLKAIFGGPDDPSKVNS